MPTTLKQHLLNMTRDSFRYESDKAAEARQGSNKTVQLLHANRRIILSQCIERIQAWQPTISAIK